MKIVGYAFLCILAIALLLGLTFGLGLFGLEYKKFFAPRHANVDRKVFEETQSYVHGKVQDLAKYFEEYNKTSDPIEKEAVRQIILMRFAEFDATQIKAQNLQSFLIEMRGY